MIGSTPSNNTRNAATGAQQPSPTEKIKDSARQTASKAQNVISGTPNKTNATQPSAKHEPSHHTSGLDNIVKPDNVHQHSTHATSTGDKPTAGKAFETSKNAAETRAAGQGTNNVDNSLRQEQKRHEGIIGKVTGIVGAVVGDVKGAAGRVTGRQGQHSQSNDVAADTHGTRGHAGQHGQSNDVAADTHGTRGHAGQQQPESRLNQTGRTVDDFVEVPSSVPGSGIKQQEQHTGARNTQPTGNNAFDNTLRADNLTGNNAFDNTRPGNQNQLGSNLTGNAYPPTGRKDNLTAGNMVDEAKRF